VGDRVIDVVVCDDVPQLRALVRLAFEDEGDLRVVGEAGDGHAGIAAVREHQPDVVVLDLAMPHLDGLQALPRIREVSPGTAVVVFSGFADGPAGEQAVADGADRYVAKGAPLTELADAVRDAVAARRRSLG
jgi:DNA-binding NarL/FixJ family response regulator